MRFTPTIKTLPLWGLIVLLSLLPPLGFYLVGEEGVYTIGAMEMWHQKDFLHQTTYGMYYARPPLIVWAIGSIANLIGFQHIVLAGRLVSFLSTLGMGYLSGVMMFQISRQLSLSWLAALITLTLGDLYFYRGWLAYADPLLGVLTMASLTTLLLAIKQRSNLWMLVSVCSIGGAFLTKSLTPFALWYSAVFVFSWDSTQKKPKLTLGQWCQLPFPPLIAILWFVAVNQHQHMGESMVGDVLQKVLASESIGGYLKKILLFPFSTALNLSPWVPLSIWLGIKYKPVTEGMIKRLGLLIFLNLIPYWLAPQSHIRYLIGLFPLMGVVSAYIIWHAGHQWRSRTMTLLMLLVILKLIFGFLLYPYYQIKVRGQNYVRAAQALLNTAGNDPIYIDDGRSVALNIVSELDRQGYPKRLISAPPNNWQDGFLLAMNPQSQYKLYQNLEVTGDKLYVYCRGKACDKPSRFAQHY